MTDDLLTTVLVWLHQRLEGAAEGIAGRLDALDAERDRATDDRSEDV